GGRRRLAGRADRPALPAAAARRVATARPGAGVCRRRVLRLRPGSRPADGHLGTARRPPRAVRGPGTLSLPGGRPLLCVGGRPAAFAAPAGRAVGPRLPAPRRLV